MTNELTYGAAFADVYDEWYGDDEDVEAAVRFLTSSQPHRVLELGVGTGRLALPLARALRKASSHAVVVGVDESPEMLAILAQRPGADSIDVVVGDMVEAQPDGSFDLVLLSYNTLFNLVSFERQAQCVANVARRLAPGGCFVIEACVIDESAPSQGSTTLRRGRWRLDIESTFDARSGALCSTTTSTDEHGRVVVRPTRITYSSPQRIDEMCRAAGLLLDTRHGSWQMTSFDDHSARHVSAYRNVR